MGNSRNVFAFDFRIDNCIRQVDIGSIRNIYLLDNKKYFPKLKARVQESY